MSEIPKIKLKEKLGFCAFSGSNNIVYQFKSLYYLFFLTNVLKMNVLWAGTILTIGTIWDALNDPLLGYLAVNRRFKNGDRVRPFALWYSLPWAAALVLLFSDFGLEGNLQIIICLAIYVVFEVFFTLVSIPYNSMSGLATDRDNDRRSINVFRNLGACVGSGVGAVACLPLLRLFGALDNAGNLKEVGGSRGFLIVAIVMGAIIVIGSFIHYFTTKERVRPLDESGEKIGVAKVAAMLFHCKSWWLNTAYIICYGVTNLLLMSCLTYYATYVLGSTAKATMIQAAYLVASVAASFAVGAVDRRLGRRRSMMLAPVIAIIGKIWFIIDTSSIGAIYVNAITVGFAVTFAFVLFNTNRNNIVDILEVTHGQRIDSMIASTDNLASKLAVAGATQMIAVSLANAGYDAALPVQPDAAIDVINFMIGWVPTIAAVLMFVSAFFLTIEKDHAAASAARKSM